MAYPFLSSHLSARPPLRRFRPRSSPQRPTLVFDPLEPRLLLNADLGLDLSSHPTASERDQNLLIRLFEETQQVNGQSQTVQKVRILDRNDQDRVLEEGDLDTLESISIRTGSGDDRVTLDAASFATVDPSSLPTVSFFGGTGEDTFVLDSPESAAWTIGEQPATVSVSVTLGVRADALTGDLGAIEKIVGGSGTDTLTGPSRDTQWVLDGADSGAVAGIAFSGIENLHGSDAGSDRFQIKSGASLTGTISGGVGQADTVYVQRGEFSSASNTIDSPGTDSIGRLALDGVNFEYSGIDFPALAVSGGDEHLTLRGTDSDDDLTLEVDPNDSTRGVLRSTNALTQPVFFSYPTQSLTIELLDGNDTLTIKRFVPGTGASLKVDGGSNGDPFKRGDRIEVAAGAVISTRNLNNPAAASGRLDLLAEVVNIGAGARITTSMAPGQTRPDDADNGIQLGNPETTPEGFTPHRSVAVGDNAVVDAGLGDIAISAVSLPFILPVTIVDFYRPKASVHIGAASLTGGDISIEATAEAYSSVEAPDGFFKGLVGNLLGILQQIPGMVVSSLTGIDATVAIREAQSSITLDGARITASGEVEISAESVAKTEVAALSISRGITNSPFQIAVAFARSQVIAEILITGSTRILAAKDITLQSEAETKAKASARTGNVLDIFRNRQNPDQYKKAPMSFAFAISNSDLKARTVLNPSTSVISSGGSVDILAKGKSKSNPSSSIRTFIEGKVGITASINYAKSQVDAIANGTVKAGGGSVRVGDFEFNPQQNKVVLSEDKILIQNHDFETGDRVFYWVGEGGEAIGGLQDGQAYYVLVGPGENTIQLAYTPPVNLSTDRVNPDSRHRLIEPEVAAFVLNAVDDGADAIHLPGHPFQQGDVVTYTHAGAQAIEGLVAGGALPGGAGRRRHHPVAGGECRGGRSHSRHCPGTGLGPAHVYGLGRTQRLVRAGADRRWRGRHWEQDPAAGPWFGRPGYRNRPVRPVRSVSAGRRPVAPAPAHFVPRRGRVGRTGRGGTGIASGSGVRSGWCSGRGRLSTRSCCRHGTGVPLRSCIRN